MKCQHCGSSDIVTIQGKDYCLSCGYAVEPAATPKGRAAATKRAGVKPVRGAAQSKTGAQSATLPPKAALPTANSSTVSVPNRTFDLRQQMAGSRRPLAPHPLRFSLSVAAVLGTMIGVAVGLVFGFQVDGDIGAYLAVASLVTLGVGSVLAQAALFYGLSRVYDRRPAPHAYWWAAARGGFMEIVNIDMIALIAGMLVLVVGAAVWRLNAHEPSLNQSVRVIVLVLINLFLGWLLVGVYVARRIGVPAVIVGGITASDGFKIGWRLYARAGSHLVVAGLEALLGRIVAVLVLALGVYGLAALVSSPSQPELVIGTAVMAGISIFVVVLVLLEWESRIWLRQYRLQVASFGPAERVRLLTGRSQSRT